MIVAFAMLVVALGSVGWYVWKLVHWDEPRIGRADTRPAPWFQLASYAGGRVTHLTPMRDGLHMEDGTLNSTGVKSVRRVLRF